MGNIDSATAARMRQQQQQNSAAQQQRELDQLKHDYEMQLERQREATQLRGPGYVAGGKQTNQEAAANIQAPGYEGTRDVQTGQLLGQYKYDPYAGEATKALKEQAFAQPGESPWAKLQLQQQALEEGNARDKNAVTQQTAMEQAQGNLARTGGFSNSARALMALQGQRGLAKSNQDIGNQGIQQRLGIQNQDIGRQQELLGNFGNAEMQAQQANIGQLTNDITRRNLFDIERYKQQMQAYGAEKQANAQANAGGGGKK